MNRRPDAEAGVSDVIGAILLVGITVTMMAGLSLVVLNIDGPPDQNHAELAISVEPGTGGWGGGDERIVLRHLGGEAMGRIEVRYSIAGGAIITLSPADQGFTDSEFRIGESWGVGTTIAEGASVQVVIIDLDGRRLVSSTSVLAGLTQGGVPGAGIDDSPLLIMTVGTATNEGNLVDEDGSYATLTEASTGTVNTFRLNPGAVATEDSIDDATNALTSNDQVATLSNVNDLLGVNGFVHTEAGTITAVRIGIEAAMSSGGASARLWYRTGGTDGASEGTFAFTTDADQTHMVDVTADNALWNAAGIGGLEVLVQRTSSPQDLLVDHLFVEVDVVQGGVSSLEGQLDWTSVQAGTSHTIELWYEAVGDDFSVYVWDWVAGAYPGTPTAVLSGGPTEWTHTLTAEQYNAGGTAVRMRIVDASGAVGPGSLFIDYARVVTT